MRLLDIMGNLIIVIYWNRVSNGIKYLRIDQVKFVEDSPEKMLSSTNFTWSILEYFVSSSRAFFRRG